MKRNTININLQPVNNQGSGIALFANKLIAELEKSKLYKIFGSFNFVRGVKKNELERFSFPVKYSSVPAKVVYSRLIKKALPFYYHNMMHGESDINLFLTYKIPRVSYSGIVISTIHDLIPLRVATENDQIQIDYRNDIDYAIRHSDYLITISEASKKDILEEFLYNKNKIFVIPNGVDFELYNNEIEQEHLTKVKEKYQLPNKFVVYLGGIRIHKNVGNLIRAYALLSEDIRAEVSLVITQGNEDLKKLAANLNIEEQVFFTPYIDEQDKPAVYKLALTMAFISSYEGFGLPIIEAMAAGTPVITSNVSSMPEVAGDAAVLVDPFEIEETKYALERIIGDADFRKKLIESGYENAKKYSWTHSGEELVKLCNTILKQQL
ncbi:glycosyltransferase family 1 protein [Flavobacterium sp. YJ01]|uniref:glycosyltransferase family 4 protein n=1 Tax=Flavobacterium sp. YJ01 TaxID=3031997 RepID=UPI0023E3843D|nr:glycosyltransferase family 1 protein [Flavobacterium sp. YJ01]WET04112.1 glycosyltransferase family 1 protein [Flavobacterium sp. YJ01]